MPRILQYIFAEIERQTLLRTKDATPAISKPSSILSATFRHAPLEARILYVTQAPSFHNADHPFHGTTQSRAFLDRLL